VCLEHFCDGQRRCNISDEEQCKVCEPVMSFEPSTPGQCRVLCDDKVRMRQLQHGVQILSCEGRVDLSDYLDVVHDRGYILDQTAKGANGRVRKTAGEGRE